MKMIDMGEIKMVNAIMYFAKNVKNPYKLKIFKLLNFLDFSHFASEGKSVTWLRYVAFERGPVPIDLYEDMKTKDFSDYFNKNLKIIKIQFDDLGEKEGYQFISKTKPDISVFTPIELEIMKNLVTIFKNSNANEMTEISHLKNTPWEKTKQSKGLFEEIDYFLNIDEESVLLREKAEEYIESREEMMRWFGND